MLNEREKVDRPDTVAEESTAPKTAVMMMDRPEDIQEEEISVNDKVEETVATKNVIIFSDSMAKYTQQYLSSREFNYQVVAHRGAQIHDVTRNVREFSTSVFDDSTMAAVVLHVGTNNLCNNQTLDQNVDDYKELLQVAAHRFPNAGILVSGILPRFDSEDLSYAVQQYNIILAQLCTTFAGKVKFVDLGSHFRSDCFFAIDGLHLSYQGNPRFAAKLQEAVEYHFSTDAEHIMKKEAWSSAMQKVPFPKPSLLGPLSSAKHSKDQSFQKEKTKVPRRCFKSVKRKQKGPTRSRRKCWYPNREKKCSDVSNWTGWTRCQGPTAACSPSGNGPKWKTEYLIRTNCCLYQNPQKTSHSNQPEANTKRGKKRKKPGESKVEPNPRDLGKLEELLAEFGGQSAPCQDPDPRPRKRKRKCAGQHLQDNSQQKDSMVSSPSTDCPVNPCPATNEADGQNKTDLHDDKCPRYPVYIRTWDGQLLTTDIADDSSVTQLHEAVAQFYKNGLPKEASFYRGGLKVKDKVPLKHQGIVAESTLQVLLKLKGGGDKGDPEESGEGKPDRHMTEWTVEEAVQWLQTEGKMRPDEVKPLVEEQVDGLALWEMTLDSLKKHFSCLSGGAKVKLLKALESYKESCKNFNHVTLPDELPANVTCWREKEIRLWLSCVVKCTQVDIDSVCALDLDGDSLLKLDEETVRDLELLPEMKQGPLLKLFSCINKLNYLLTPKNPGVEVVVREKSEEAKVSLSSVETSLNEATSDISDGIVGSLVGASGETNQTNTTEAIIDVSGQKKESQVADDSTTVKDRDKTAIEDLIDVKDDIGEAMVQGVPSDKDPKSTLSVTPGSEKEPTPAICDKQVSHQKLAQVELAQPSTKPVKLTEKETAILHLLKSSGLNLYESPLTQNFQHCEMGIIYARPKKKNELDHLFNFLVIRKVQDSNPPNQSQVAEFTKHLWGKIRKDLCHWMDFLPKKCRKAYHVDPNATSSENVFLSKDKTMISLSKKDPTCVPLGQVDIAVFKSIKAATTIFIVEESFTSEEPQEYVTLCGAKDRQYYFQYCTNSNWHASFDEINLIKRFVMKENVMATKSNLAPLEEKSKTDKESPSIPPQSPKELPDELKTETDEMETPETITTSKSITESKDGAGDSSASDSKLIGTGKTEESSMIAQESNIADNTERDEIQPFPFGRSLSDRHFKSLSYRRDATLAVMESGSGSNLLSACHEFKVFQQIKSTDQKIPPYARTYFLEETFRFATGCINARRNGTIHFGVGDDVDKEKKYKHGQIVGIGLHENVKAKFDDAIKDSVVKYFTQDWAASAVDQCIYPVRFIPVDEKHLDSGQSDMKKYVIEVDVEPTFAITQHRAFFYQKSKKEGERLYLRKRASTPPLTGSELDNFQYELLPKLVQQRKELEQKRNSTSERPSQNFEHNAKKLKGCLLGGETDLKTKYPILFISKPDFHSEDIKSDLRFIADIPWTAIFDLDPKSDGNGICNWFRSQMKKESFLYMPEKKFLYFSDHDELAETILFPEKTCWIFVNGRRALEVEVDPCDDKKWNGTERCKAVKNAISFFSRPDKIPPGKAVIVFLVLSEEIEILVNCFRYCFDDFYGIDNFLCLFDNENICQAWEDQVQNICNLEDLQRKSIVSMPYAHINQTLQFMSGLQTQSEPLIPTSSGSGSYVSLTKQFRNKLDDLEVLSKNQCEDLDLDPESDYFEEISQEKEMMFYKGNEVHWLNFFFTDIHNKNHVMKREKFRELHKLVSAALFRREPQLKRKSNIITLYYQAGSGATTLGRHILWEFRESNVRCCVVQRITDDTAKQILDLRRYGEETENECLPVLMLIDNRSEELVNNLITDLELQIKKRGIATGKPICIILQCKLMQDAKKHHDDNPTASEYLEQSVSKNEMRWLEKKQKELEGTILEEDFIRFESDARYAEDAGELMTETEEPSVETPLNLDKDPRRFIKFMILRKNFDPEFVRNFVANSLNEIQGNEMLLLYYTALLNVFVKKVDSFVPLHCAEALMGIADSKYRTMDNTLSGAVKVFLILVERVTYGSVQGYKIVDSLLAREILNYVVANHETYSSIACDFLESRLFCCDAYTRKDLIFFTKEMLKRRKKFAYGDDIETQFSPLVELICEKEGHQNAAAVLKKGLNLDMFADPVIAQTLARLFLRHDDFAEAHKYADIAVEQDPNNSYLWVTAGKVYHEEMIKNFDRIEGRPLTLPMLQNALALAQSAVEQYSKSHEANRTGKYPPNLHCYLEEIKICFKLLFMIIRVNPFKGKVRRVYLQRYLIEPEFVPDEVQEVWKDYHEWIKSIKPRIDASIDRLEKDLRYNKPKSRDKEHERFKGKFYEQVRNYPQFFGKLEYAEIASDEERKRLEACTILKGHKVNFSIVFDLIKNGKNAVRNFERVMEQLMTITKRNAFDLEGLISVSLALSTVDPHSKKIPSFKQVYDWCVELSTLTPSTLEPHLFLTMFLWPREDMDIKFDGGLFKLSKEKLSILHKEQCPRSVLRHVQAHKRMTTTGYTRPMPATNFFLSTGKGLQSFVHISSLNVESQKNFDRDQFWESDGVQEKLRRLEGICLASDKISYRVNDGPIIEIHSSRPIAIKGISQDIVSFFLGFSWEGPIAYNVKVREDW